MQLYFSFFPFQGHSRSPRADIQLFLQFFSAEGCTDALISELMKAQKSNNDPQKVLEEMERERREMEEMFTIKAGEVDKLREKDVLRKSTFCYVFFDIKTSSFFT